MFFSNRSRNFPKDPAQGCDGEEKFGRAPSSGCDPRTERRQQRDNADEMVFERLVPGVQHCDETDPSAKTRAAKLKERFTDGLKQKS